MFFGKFGGNKFFFSGKKAGPDFDPFLARFGPILPGTPASAGAPRAANYVSKKNVTHRGVEAHWVWRLAQKIWSPDIFTSVSVFFSQLPLDFARTGQQNALLTHFWPVFGWNARLGGCAARCQLFFKKKCDAQGCRGTLGLAPRAKNWVAGHFYVRFRNFFPTSPRFREIGPTKCTLLACLLLVGCCLLLLLSTAPPRHPRAQHRSGRRTKTSC